MTQMCLLEGAYEVRGAELTISTPTCTVTSWKTPKGRFLRLNSWGSDSEWTTVMRALEAFDNGEPLEPFGLKEKP